MDSNLKIAARNKVGIEEAVKQLETLGKTFAAASQCLADHYYAGDFLPKNLKKAFEWTTLAAKQGDLTAQGNLGICYSQGLGVEKDYTKAVYWSERAAKEGKSNAQNNLGIWYAMGTGVEKDYKKALDWFKKASDLGHLNAQTSLAWMYQDGVGVEADIKTSLYYWRLAERQGDPVAKLRLAEEYMFGDDGPIDKVLSFKLVEESAAAGNSQAIFNLGVCYANGMGVAANPSEAINYIRKAAEQNLPGALSGMGYIYQNGYGEIKPDYELAIHWLERAVKHGSTEAEKMLSDLQDQGSVVTQIGTSAISDAVFEQTLMKLMRNATPNQSNLAQTMVFRDESAKHVFDRSIKELIAADETQEIEFKETFNTPTKTEGEGKPPSTNKVRYWALKEIAGFLNSNDGTLLIGVIDGSNNSPTHVPIISGIDHDQKDSKSLNKDEYKRAISDVVADAFGDAAAQCVNIKLEEIDNKTVCRIDCKKSYIPVYYDVKKIDEKRNRTTTFIRLDSITREPKDMREWDVWKSNNFKHEN